MRGALIAGGRSDGTNDGAASSPEQDVAGTSDDDMRRLLIEHPFAEHVGPCLCPGNIMEKKQQNLQGPP